MNNDSTTTKSPTKSTAKKVAWTVIVPSEKIKSKEGAVLPKEVLKMTKIQPAITVKKKVNTPFFVYGGIGIAVVLIIFIALKKIHFKN